LVINCRISSLIVGRPVGETANAKTPGIRRDARRPPFPGSR
jgi:hypothetical protein